MIPGAAASRAAVLYTRSDCPLCFVMRRAARRAARRHRVTLRIVDLGGRPELTALYATEIPVLILPDGTRFAGKASATALDRAFRTAAGGSPGWRARLAGFLLRARGEHG